MNLDKDSGGNRIGGRKKVLESGGAHQPLELLGAGVARLVGPRQEPHKRVLAEAAVPESNSRAYERVDSISRATRRCFGGRRVRGMA
jgi:hypothetical protein